MCAVCGYSKKTRHRLMRLNMAIFTYTEPHSARWRGSSKANAWKNSSQWIFAVCFPCV